MASRVKENDNLAGIEMVIQEGWSILRTLHFTKNDIHLVALNAGRGWKATVEGSPICERLEFHGLMPKTALDCAEAFVRRLTE